jgi:2-amino-4-hydroxy-6-hydroxymethyldihydropteridine diphosphokinase
MPQVFIGMGANISPERNIRESLLLLCDVLDVIDVSTFYRTPALDRPDEAPFINGVIKAETDADPFILKFHILRRVEEALGRERTPDPSSPRTIDLDLLVYDRLVLSAEGLVLPDPDILRRPFLAIPLCQLDPQLTLPGDGRNICLAARGMDDSEMEPLPFLTGELKRIVQCREWAA